MINRLPTLKTTLQFHNIRGCNNTCRIKPSLGGILVYPIFLRQSRSSLSENEGLLIQNPGSMVIANPQLLILRQIIEDPIYLPL